MHLVCRTVPQALVEAWPHEDTRLHLPPRETIVENLIPCRLQAQIIPHDLRQPLQRHIVERGSVAQAAHLTPHLPQQRLQELCYRHAAGDAMRIDDDIRYESRGRGRHVLRVQDHPASPLLTMARRELVTNLRNPVLSHTNFGERVPLPIPVLEDAIHPTRLVIPHSARHVTVALCPRRNHHPCWNTQRHMLPNKNVIRVDIAVLGYEPRLVQLIVVRVLHLLRHTGIGTHEALLLTRGLILALLVLVRPVEDGTEEAAIQGSAINHDRILLVVASVGQDCDYNVLAGRHCLCPIEAAHEG